MLQCTLHDALPGCPWLAAPSIIPRMLPEWKMGQVL